MATLELTGIAIIIVVAVIALPILFQDNPTAFVENSLCIIFAGGSNTTCNQQVRGNVTFIGNFPIVITPNNTENTITWMLGDIGNASHANIGGEAEVFKNETSGIALFRTLLGAGAFSITQEEETITIQTGGGGSPINNINNGSGNNLFASSQDGDTVTFVGRGIAIRNTSSIVFSLNATIGEFQDVNVTNVDEDQVLIYNITSGQFENEVLAPFVALHDITFNAEEATVDDLTGLDCVNDVTISFFDQAEIDEYRRQAIQFCPDSDIDDNITWLYTVPKDYQTDEDFKFRLFWTDQSPNSGMYISIVNGDSEENVITGTVSTGSPDIELHDQSTTFSDGYVAMHFPVVTIPNGALITGANIQFHVDEVGSSTVTSTFRGHSIDNSPQVSGASFDISSRNETVASVDWVIPSWPTISEEGPNQLTPDLSTIVQEIVDRPGWLSGNDLMIMIKAWPDNSGTRTAETLNGEPTNAATITITFSTGGGGNPPVCFEFSLMAISNTEVLDGNFVARDTQCANRSGQDSMSINEFTVNAIDHDFNPEDLVFIRIVRPNDFVPNDFEADVFVLGGELQWDL